jgi:hypothetical protein
MAGTSLVRPKLVQQRSQFSFFHTLTGVIGPSGVSTLLAVVVMLPPLRLTRAGRAETFPGAT